MQEDPVGHLHETLGDETIRSMVAAFYRRIPEDTIIGPMYPKDDMEGSEERLADFLVLRFGGPQTYLEKRGHPRLRMRHASFSIGPLERDRWLQLMGEAAFEVGISDEHREPMMGFLAGVAEMLRNRE